MTLLLDGLYAVCDLLLGWTALFGPAGAIVAVGLLSGAAVVLFQKYASRQDLLARCKADLALLKPRIRDAKKIGDAETAKRLIGLQGRIGMRSMQGHLPPLRPSAAADRLALAGLKLDVADADGFTAALRGSDPPVIARIQDGRVLLDPRTVLPGQDDQVVAALLAVTKAL